MKELLLHLRGNGKWTLLLKHKVQNPPVFDTATRTKFRFLRLLFRRQSFWNIPRTCFLESTLWKLGILLILRTASFQDFQRSISAFPCPKVFIFKIFWCCHVYQKLLNILCHVRYFDEGFIWNYNGLKLWKIVSLVSHLSRLTSTW